MQAINDFILFTVAGAGSLISGVVYSDLGGFGLLCVDLNVFVCASDIFSKFRQHVANG